MKKISFILAVIGIFLIIMVFTRPLRAEEHIVKEGTFDITTTANGDVILVSGTVTLTGDANVQKSVNILCAVGTKLTIQNVNIYPYSQSAPALWFEGGQNNRLFASGRNTLRGDSRYPAISVAKCGALTIDGGTNSSIAAHGTDNSAGIGGGYSSTDTCGTIIIDGGNIIATGSWGAGIGAGSYSFCEKIIINGGNITATSGSGAGIGAGYYSGCGAVIINGGRIRATANSFGAGIGGGNRANANCESIEINGGDIVAIANWGAGVGAGYYSCCGAVDINNGKINVVGTLGAAGIGRGENETATCGAITINGGTITASCRKMADKDGLPSKSEVADEVIVYSSDW